jgi:hypothetical protein
MDGESLAVARYDEEVFIIKGLIADGADVSCIEPLSTPATKVPAYHPASGWHPTAIGGGDEGRCGAPETVHGKFSTRVHFTASDVTGGKS